MTFVDVWQWTEVLIWAYSRTVPSGTYFIPVIARSRPREATWQSHEQGIATSVALLLPRNDRGI